MPLLNDVNAVLLGTNPVDAVYLGDTKVWPSGPPFTIWRRLRCQFGFDDLGENGIPAGYFKVLTATHMSQQFAFLTRADIFPVDLDDKPLWDNPNLVFKPAGDWFKTGEDVGFWHVPTGTMLLTRQVVEWLPSIGAQGDADASYFGVDTAWGPPIPFVEGDEYVIGRPAL